MDTTIDIDLLLNRRIATTGITSDVVSAPNQGKIYFDQPSGKYKVSENGAAYVNLVGGASMSASTVLASVVATDTLSQFDPVTITGHKADSSNISRDFGRVIGIASTAVSIGFAGSIIVDGIVINAGWSWTPGATIFLNGTTLSQTPPGSGFSQEIGIAQSANVIYIDVSAPILL